MTEGEVIRILTEAGQGPGGRVRIGIGDDAAVLRPSPGMDWVVTQDALVEDVHFRRRWMDAESLGWKTMAVSLSDLAAMGAEPRAAFLTLALPEGSDADWVRGLARGVARCLARYGARLAGGDTVRSPDRIFVDGVLMGEVPQEGAIRRDSARVGDRLLVTGYLGGAALGLRLVEGGQNPEEVAAATVTDADREASRRARARLLRPQPRVEAGVAVRHVATAMADLSDGLAGAVTALCEASGVGATLDASHLPVDPAVRTHGPALGLDPVSLAVWGGEDYELLLAVPSGTPERLPRFLGEVRWTEIGEVVGAGEGRTLLRNGVREELGVGYDAFRDG